MIARARIGLDHLTTSRTFVRRRVGVVLPLL